MDFAVNIFRFVNRRGYSLPHMNIAYAEERTGAEWRITCGGTRAYLLRFATPLGGDMTEQAADSHFMASRVASALLLGGLGLFQPEPMGRLLFTGVGDCVTYDCHFDLPDPQPPKSSDEVIKRVYGWLGALCSHRALRRAADDARLALSHPHEALLYIYRGLEWLVVGLGMKWEDLAADCHVSLADVRDLKRAANHDTGVRHATKTGAKMRADPDNYGSWACGLFDALTAARERLESGYTRMGPQEVADAVMRAMSVVPYE